MNVKTKSDDIQFLLQGQLDNCSRQRLRALETSLNRYSNSEYRITPKEMQSAFQENDIHLSEITIKELCDYYSDKGGVNFQAVHQSLQETQSRTGRDSVIAMKKKPVRKQRPKEEQMEDLVQRLRKVMLCTPINIEEVEKVLSEKDNKKTNLLPKDEVFIDPDNSHVKTLNVDLMNLFTRVHIDETLSEVRNQLEPDPNIGLLFCLNDLDLPIYGALLDALASSLLDTKNSHLVRWRQILNVIGMIQNNANINHVMAILVPVEKNKIQSHRHIRMTSDSKPRPTHDLHSGSKIPATNQNRQGKVPVDFELSTRNVNQSNKRESHGMEPRKSISVIPQNLLQKTGTTIGIGRRPGVKNESLIPKPDIISSEQTNPNDVLGNAESTDNVSDDTKEKLEPTEISVGLQQMALAVEENLSNIEASQ